MKESVQLMTFEPSIHFEAKASRHICGNLHSSSLLKIVAIGNRSLRLHDLVLMRAMIHAQASNLATVNRLSRCGLELVESPITLCGFHAGLDCHTLLIPSVLGQYVATRLVWTLSSSRNETSMQDPRSHADWATPRHGHS